MSFNKTHQPQNQERTKLGRKRPGQATSWTWITMDNGSASAKNSMNKIRSQVISHVHKLAWSDIFLLK